MLALSLLSFMPIGKLFNLLCKTGIKALYPLNYNLQLLIDCVVSKHVLYQCASCAQNCKWSSLSPQIQTILMFPHLTPPPTLSFMK